MTTASLSPNGTRSGAGAFTISGSATTIYGALSDNNDTTFVTRTSPTVRGEFVVDMGTTSVSASQAIESVRVGVRNNRTNANARVFIRQGYLTDPAAGVVRYGTPDQFVGTTSSIETQYGAARISAPDGRPWDQDRLNNLVLKVTDYATASAALTNVMELFAEAVLNTQPSASVTAPTGTVSETSRPAVAWTYTDADGDPQSVYEVRLFTSAQYGATGFDPGTSAATYETGLVQSSDPGHAVPIDLENSASLRAYVRVGHPISTTVFLSDWEFSQFVMNYESSPAPILSAQFSERDNAVFVTATGRSNYLTADDASVEDTLGTWAVISGANVTRVTSVASHGSAAISLAATSTVATMSAQTDPYEVATDGQRIWAVADFRADANARACRVILRWFDENDAFISATAGTQVTDALASWTTASVSGLPPANATKASVAVEVTSPVAAEVHYVDKIALHNGASPVWSPGGLFPDQQIIAERSLDDGVTWTALNTVDADSPEQTAQFDDFTSPRDSVSRYRARVIATVGQDTITSPNSEVAAAYVANDGKWWIKALGSGLPGCPCPAYNMSDLRVRGPIGITTEQNIGVFRPLGRDTPVVVAGDLYGDDGEYVITFLTDAEWEDARTLFYDWTGDTLVQDPSGGQKVIRVTNRSMEHSISFSHPKRDLTITYVQVD